MNINYDSLENETQFLAELLDYKDRFTIALKAAKVCVFEVDLTRQLYTFFENSEDIFGVSSEIILNDVQPYSKLTAQEYQQAVSDYFSHPDDADIIDAAFKKILSGQPTTYQARMKVRDTRFIWCKIDAYPIIKDGIAVKMIGVITDISDIRSHTDNLEKKVNHDSFTGLYNKKYAMNLIHTVLCRQPYQKHALVLFDVDNFKYVNDTYGHAEGDQALKFISADLNKRFGKEDIIGRFGGDEFIVLLNNIPNDSYAISKVEQLLRSIEKHCKATISAGMALYPAHSTDLTELFQKADEALYRAKRTKNTYALYDSY